MSKQIIEGVAAYVKIPDGGKGLDVGCGSGALTIASAKKNPAASMTGIDRWGKEYASFNKKLCESNSAAEGVNNTSFMQDFKPLSNDEHHIVERAAQIMKDAIAIPCTACHYCTDGCPQSICIPEYFNVYNMLHMLGDAYKGNSQMYYNLHAKNHGRANECIECGQCETHCPQGIDIVERLKQVAATFEH